MLRWWLNHSRRCSSSGGDARRGKPDLVLARKPDRTAQQQPSSGTSAPSRQYLGRGVLAFGELKVRETLTGGGEPVDLAGLYMQGETRAKAVVGQAYTYMNLLQVSLAPVSAIRGLSRAL